MKRLITLLTFCLTSLVISAYDFEVNGIFYNIIKGNNVEVTYKSNKEYGDYKGTVTIPASVSYDGTDYSVVGIGERAFYECYGLQSVSIPSSVVSIGKESFYSCEKITSIILPSELKIIENHAFYDCKFESIVIPNSVTSIGEGAFCSCPISEIVIPNSVTTLGAFVFSQCDKLKSVTFSYGLKEIPHNCFFDCDELTSIIIPTGVESIGFSAFTYCRKLQSVTIPNTVKEIGDGVFYDCLSLESINIPNSVTNIGINTFENCEKLKEVNLSDNIKELPKYMFWNCSSLETIVLPSSIKKIREAVFYGCKSLKFIKLPEYITKIENHVLAGCESLETVIIPENVTSIGVSFSNCKSLMNVYCYAKKVPEISDQAFNGANVVYSTLYVPQESVNQYKSAPTWSDFGKILPIDKNYSDIQTPITAINPIKVKKSFDGSVYNLQGQKVGDTLEGLPKGVYIKDGKKQVVK